MASQSQSTKFLVITHELKPIPNELTTRVAPPLLGLQPSLGDQGRGVTAWTSPNGLQGVV